jgi:L-ascorbate metabolism protein UlaG (beta-lactamase superfamily)
MKITAVYHSCFVVELERSVLLFDYYRGTLPPLPADKELFVLVSHKHPDHYSPAIWELEKRYPRVCYVLFEAVPGRKGDNILYVSARRSYEFHGLSIETLASTDEGCAFLVRAEGKTLYHAGDLNWWHWEGEPGWDNGWHERAFKEEIEALRGRHLDCAFLPLDPRQEQNAWWGFAEVLKLCRVDHVFPMHYFNAREKMLSYLSLPQLAPWRDKIVTAETAVI